VTWRKNKSIIFIAPLVVGVKACDSGSCGHLWGICAGRQVNGVDGFAKMKVWYIFSPYNHFNKFQLN
jgi:hypothetical protein